MEGDCPHTAQSVSRVMAKHNKPNVVYSIVVDVLCVVVLKDFSLGSRYDVFDFFFLGKLAV